MVFDDACGQCLCTSCLTPVSSCLGSFGCLAILGCFEQTNCQGFGCYQPGTCRGVIDFFGGLSSSSMGQVATLLACGALSGCACE
jgi:hypothetical protein